MKRHIVTLLNCLIVVLLVAFLLPSAWAQNPEEMVKKYGITFPIAELGNCSDYSECRNFCEDPIYQSVCIDFARKKGFHKEEQFETQKSRFIEAAKAELGCSSEEACREFCSQETNWEKCGEFARKHKLHGGHVQDPKDAEVLEKAKQELGCTSFESCLSFCSQEVNRQRCSDFANKVGLRGGEHRVGPGGCASEETCKTFCSDPNNFGECSKFGGGPGGHGERFHGPGGCNSEDSCRAYCENNPQDCTIVVVGEHGGVADPVKAKEEYAKYCSENPEKCSMGGQGPFGSEETRQEFEKFCTDNPEKCGTTGGLYPGAGGYTESNLDHKSAECVKYGCSWTGTTCQCQGGQDSPTNYNPPPSGEYLKDSSIEGKCVQAGCTWTGSSCQCSSSNYATPQEATPNQ